MRHRNTKSKLGRTYDHRKAMVRNLITSLFDHGKIKTTEKKAKLLVKAAEKLIFSAKKDIQKKAPHNAIRKLNKIIYTQDSSKKALAYAENLKQESGFTRISKIKYQDGDNAVLVSVELL